MEHSRVQALGTVSFAVCIVVTSTEALLAQGRLAAEEAKADADLQLRLSTTSTRFHSGEVIPLELTFTSATPNRYQINLARYDRSGRMNYEQFLLDPKEGTRDPLQLYFNSIMGFLGGGLTTFQFLSTSPTTIHLDLNEWVSSDRPGTYRLSVVSHRVSDSATSNDPWGGAIELKSNSIGLQITSPDAAWQQAQITKIRQALDWSPGSALSTQDESRQTAIRALRYLGSEEAARELARRLRGENINADFDCMFGLIGSRHRSAGQEEMNKLLEDPEFPVTDLFLTAMSMLPLDPNDSAEALRKERDESLKVLGERLVAALSSKRGKALSASLDTALTGIDSSMPAKIRSELVPQLIESFSSLPIDKQVAWLQYRWDAVKDPRWLPLLRTVALQYKDYPELRVMDAYQSLQLTGASLRRWYELDPEGARDAVIAEIARPKPRYDMNTLGLLPDKTLPEVQHLIAEHFLATDNYEIEGNLASLLFRYADANVLPELLGKVNEQVGKWACDPQDKMLAYVLRVDPATAKPLIERAVAARGPESTACRHAVFTDIGALQTDPVLEELATKSLNDPDPEVANDAARYLGDYGSADAEHALWDRYEAWSREWSGRASELRYVCGGQNPHVWDEGLGENLARALARGLGWLSDETALRRIESLGVGPTIQQNTEAALQAWLERPLTITYAPTGVSSAPWSFSVAQYDLHSLGALKTKLGQFPRGTKFLLSPLGPTLSPEEKKIFQEISEVAGENEIELLRPLPPVQ